MATPMRPDASATVPEPVGGRSSGTEVTGGAGEGGGGGRCVSGPEDAAGCARTVDDGVGATVTCADGARRNVGADAVASTGWSSPVSAVTSFRPSLGAWMCVLASTRSGTLPG